MTTVKNFTLVIIFMAIAFTEVASWTVDLPEVRKYFFNRNKAENAFNVDPKFKSYDNIKGNSLHNTDARHYDKYVDNHDVNKNYNKNMEHYEDAYRNNLGIMEKKVHDVVQKGSKYLEGLRRSLEQYMDVLKNCSQTNFTNGIIPLPPTGIPPTLGPPNPAELTTSQPSNNAELLANFTGITAFMMQCRNATEKREYVRRMADLALWATKRLEDIAYAAKYQEVDEKEENELLLLLAYYLDRIAHHTGYDPNVEDFLEEPSTTPLTTLPAVPMPFDNVPRPVVEAMMNCLKNKSAIPATERCNIPVDIPEVVQRAFNLSEPTTPTPPTISDSVPNQSSLELLIAADTGVTNFPPKLTAVKSVQKRSINDSPLLKVMKYYAKHKVWIGSNPLEEATEVEENFDVPNHIRQKRALTYKKNIHIRVPDNPMKALTGHIKNKAGIHYVNNKIEADLLKKSLEKIRHKTNYIFKHNLKNMRPKRSLLQKKRHLLIPAHPIRVIKDHLKKKSLHFINNNVEAKLFKDVLNKMRHTTSVTVKHNLKKVFKRNKRAVHYGRMYKPRASENPYQDLSYYIKNRAGTNFNNDPVQAAQVRLGLEQAFQTGNIEIVRRYGSNFNPANPNPFYTGVILTMSDI